MSMPSQRDLFAGLAMHAMLRNLGDRTLRSDHLTTDEVNRVAAEIEASIPAEAFRIADAMLKAGGLCE